LLLVKTFSHCYDSQYHTENYKDHFPLFLTSRMGHTPVFKKGKKEDPGNYRPLSLSSIPGKVMKQLILHSVIKQVEEKKVIRSS